MLPFFTIKKGQATYIAPLQLPTLASVKIWGDSAGADRIRLTLAQMYKKIYSIQLFLVFFLKNIHFFVYSWY